MIIADPARSLEHLVGLLRTARRRILVVAFQFARDTVGNNVVDVLNQKAGAGVRVVFCAKSELIIGTVEHAPLDPRVEHVVPPPNHAKIIVVDDTVISTDRNMTDAYYGKEAVYEAVDLVFESRRISTAVFNHVASGRLAELLDVTDGERRFVMGHIAEQVTSALRNARIAATCIFIPSDKMLRVLEEAGCTVITSEGTTPPLFKDAISVLQSFVATHDTFLYPGTFHQKIILTRHGTAAQGSFNLDTVSEHYTVEHMVFTRNRKEVQDLRRIVYSLRRASVRLARRSEWNTVYEVGSSLLAIALGAWYAVQSMTDPANKRGSGRDYVIWR